MPYHTCIVMEGTEVAYTRILPSRLELRQETTPTNHEQNCGIEKT